MSRKFSIAISLILWRLCIIAEYSCHAGISPGHMDDFFSAARTGNIVLLKEFLDAGVDVSSVDQKGNSAIIIASGRGKVDVLQLLLSAGANVESFTNDGLFQGKTALMWASSQGRTEAVELLIKMGASVQREMDSGVFQGKTALMWASSQGRDSVAMVLLKAGADPDYYSRTGNFKGKRALMWASSQGRLETVAVLLEAGADADNADNDGITALMWAAGSDRDDSDGHKKGLFEKANKGQIGVVKLLLRYGSSPDMQDNDGITALMYASFHGHSEAVHALLVAGADPALRNVENRTAHDLARSAGYMEVARVLSRGPRLMDMSMSELLDVTVCGWLLSILRWPFFEPGQIKRLLVMPVGERPTLKNSCSELSKHGLDGTMGDALYLATHSSVDEIVLRLGRLNFASKTRSREQLVALMHRYMDLQRNHSQTCSSF